MSQNSKEELARELVISVLHDKDRQFETSFNITDTDDEIVVIVRRRKKAEGDYVRETIKSFPVATMPKGEKCPLCGGTGRVS